MLLSAKEKNNVQRLTSSTEGVAGRGRKDLSGKILKCHYFFMVLDYCFEIQSSFLITATTRLRKCVHRIKCCYTTSTNAGTSDPQQRQPGCIRAWKRGHQNCPVLLNSSEHKQLGANTLNGLKWRVIPFSFMNEKQWLGRSNRLLTLSRAETNPPDCRLL